MSFLSVYHGQLILALDTRGTLCSLVPQQILYEHVRGQLHKLFLTPYSTCLLQRRLISERRWRDLAKLYNYVNHPPPLFSSKLKKDPNQHDLCTAPSGRAGFSFHLIPYGVTKELRGSQHQLASLGVIPMTPTGMFKFPTGSLKTNLVYQKHEY